MNKKPNGIESNAKPIAQDAEILKNNKTKKPKIEINTAAIMLDIALDDFSITSKTIKSLRCSAYESA